MVLHFQMTLPLPSEANEAPGIFFIGSRPRSPVFPEFFGSEKNYFLELFSFLYCFGKRGAGCGSKANKARQGRQAVCNYDRISRGFLAGR